MSLAGNFSPLISTARSKTELHLVIFSRSPTQAPRASGASAFVAPLTWMHESGFYPTRKLGFPQNKNRISEPN